MHRALQCRVAVSSRPPTHQASHPPDQHQRVEHCALDAWLGDFSDIDRTRMTSTPSPGAVRIFNTGGLTISGRGAASLGTMYANTITFSQNEAQMRLVRSVGSADQTSTLLRRLFQKTHLSIDTSATSLGTLPRTKDIADVLSAALPSIDRTLSATLDALGLSAGRIDVIPLGLRCDSAMLVQ